MQGAQLKDTLFYPFPEDAGTKDGQQPLQSISMLPAASLSSVLQLMNASKIGIQLTTLHAGMGGTGRKSAINAVNGTLR